MLIVLSILGTLAAIAIPAVGRFRYRAEIAQAIGEIRTIQMDILGYEATNQQLPPSLAAVGRGGMTDPWGNPYQYLNFSAAGGGAGKGKGAPPPGARMDRFLVPINSDFDLYSVGRDGKSQPPLTASVSLDDVVRGNDGGFIGPASRY